MWFRLAAVLVDGLGGKENVREPLPRCAREAGLRNRASGAAGEQQRGRYSGNSQAGTRLGWEALRHLRDEVVKPIAVAATK